jgi:hypothetical protein
MTRSPALVAPDTVPRLSRSPSRIAAGSRNGAFADAAVRRELVPEEPDELREIRRSLGFDFGKFDYSIVNGRVVLYDRNRTPSVKDR